MATATAEKPAAEKVKRDPKPKLTNSQRLRLVDLVKSPASPTGKQETTPYLYFVSVGYATKNGDGFKITPAGKERAGTIDIAKYEAIRDARRLSDDERAKRDKVRADKAAAREKEKAEAKAKREKAAQEKRDLKAKADAAAKAKKAADKKAAAAK